MTDKKLTDNEVVKALECCRDIDIKCETCQLWTDSECTEVLYQATINLINRLQAENERLKDCIDEQDIEIARLWKRIEEAKAEAYKEFAFRLKKEYTFNGLVSVEEIDELLDKLVGEKNESTH